MSYAIGMNIGNSIKRGRVDLNVDTLSTAIKDVLAGRTTKLTERRRRKRCGATRWRPAPSTSSRCNRTIGDEQEGGSGFPGREQDQAGRQNA